jgi:hypothetical protein
MINETKSTYNIILQKRTGKISSVSEFYSIVYLSIYLTPQMAKESSYALEDRLLRAILGIQVSTSKKICLKLPIGGRGRVIGMR